MGNANATFIASCCLRTADSVPPALGLLLAVICYVDRTQKWICMFGFREGVSSQGYIGNCGDIGYLYGVLSSVLMIIISDSL